MLLASCHERAIWQPYAHLCVSAAVATELRDGWGIEAMVIPNGVDFARFAAPDRPESGAGRPGWGSGRGSSDGGP
jgi:hypothetical protein